MIKWYLKEDVVQMCTGGPTEMGPSDYAAIVCPMRCAMILHTILLI